MPVQPDRPCASTEPGHNVDPAASGMPTHSGDGTVRGGWVVRIQREVVVVAFDGGVIGRFRHHDTVHLGGLTIDYGPRISFSPKQGLLHLVGEDGVHLFNLKPDTGEPLSPCTEP